MTVRNWKTTAGGVIMAIGQVLPYFGVAQDIANAVTAIGAALLGLSAKDYNVSGTGSEAAK